MFSTSQKIRFARTLSFLVVSVRGLGGMPPTTTASRHGINWSLDLKEGIDLSIYVLGGFEPRTLQRYKNVINNGDVVLDIGANIGAHTLPLAQLVGATGTVLAFEPTEYAFAKLTRNIALNPQLKSRVIANQMMLVDSASHELPDAIYSSWPMESSDDLHSEHRGRLKSTSGAATRTLDDYCDGNRVSRVNFIKLDVDGHEHDVLLGGQATLRKFRPCMMLELAPYVYDARPDEFDAMLDLLWSIGYRLTDLTTGNVLPRDPGKIRGLIPEQGGMNALARAA